MSVQLDRYDAILCDIDGCLIAGETVLAGARDLVARFGARLIAVSNNSTDTPRTLAARLARIGLPIPAERIVLAGVTAVDRIAARMPGARLALYGSAHLAAHARAQALILDDREADIVLLTRDIDFTYARLERVVALLQAGARLVVANIDATHPAADGGLVPETGALLGAITTCLPGLTYDVIGKPEAPLFDIALEKARTRPDRAILIGDNPATDGEGAHRIGMAFAAIGRGGARDIAELLGPAPPHDPSGTLALSIAERPGTPQNGR